ncbi:DUF4365 domain-containing protein [Pseudomonas sp. NA-150]|uniref:DUF4365 domain-containing protein n=1 Tax=Pseudomonas sp. NA-150 TaxID=3367525 RepID=UPI0037CB85F7
MEYLWSGEMENIRFVNYQKCEKNLNNYDVDQGSIGESVVSNYLTMIFNGEVTKETMRGEGIGALDLQLKFKSSFPENSFTQVAVQVKTGPSFGTWTPSKNRFRLQGIKSAHLDKWRASNQPVLLIWVRLDPVLKLYWKLITKKTPLETLSVSENHLLTPASRPEIERLLNIHKTGPTNIQKIDTHSLMSTADIREWSKPRFAKVKGVVNSCLGHVRISNYSWRHLTRVTRPQSHIQDSLTALPYIKLLLSATPHQIQTLSVNKIEQNGRVIVTQKVLAIYRDVRFSDKKTCAVYVRLDERLEFKNDWKDRALIRQTVRHDLKLESIFRKKTEK